MTKFGGKETAGGRKKGKVQRGTGKGGKTKKKRRGGVKKKKMDESTGAERRSVNATKSGETQISVHAEKSNIFGEKRAASLERGKATARKTKIRSPIQTLVNPTRKGPGTKWKRAKGKPTSPTRKRYGRAVKQRDGVKKNKRGDGVSRKNRVQVKGLNIDKKSC